MSDVSQAFQPQAAQAAIAKIESGGDYNILGPQTKSGDRAYGKYQIMGANIPQWTQAALGKAMTPQEFLADKQAQDAVFNHQFGGYVQKFGPADAASLWLTGRTLANGGATAADQNGTTGAAYAKQFTQNLAGAPAASGAAHTPTWAEVEADNAQGMANINARTAAKAPLAAMASLAPPAPSGAPPSAPANPGVSAIPTPASAPPPSNPYASLAAIIGSAAPQLASAPAPEVPQTPKAPPRDPAAIARALTQGLAGNLTLA